MLPYLGDVWSPKYQILERALSCKRATTDTVRKNFVTLEPFELCTAWSLPVFTLTVCLCKIFCLTRRLHPGLLRFHSLFVNSVILSSIKCIRDTTWHKAWLSWYFSYAESLIVHLNNLFSQRFRKSFSWLVNSSQLILLPRHLPSCRRSPGA